MVSNDQLSTSKAIQRRTGKTFHVATRVLPERVRHPTYVLYAFFRLADEVVDDPGDRTPEEQRERLAEIREAALGRRETDDPVLDAFDEVRRRHGIPDREVESFVDAMATDVDTDRYRTHEELSEYMRGSAAAVGNMMTAVMGTEDPERARPHAEALGEAFQLTNFLRDVREDVVERDRIYLPRESLAAQDVPVGEVEDLEMSRRFRDLMQSELRRTEDRYREGVAGIKYLPEDCQFAVLVSAVLYAEHHRLIRARDYDVLSETPELSMARRIYLVARTRLAWFFNKDPEAVFESVSAIPTGEDTSSIEGHEGGQAYPSPST
ncbi:geranylgeranyl-diphosphate geranylgeranyltransferase [Halobacteriales archaeon QS_8_69_26]|nr:MAG: geranylgeranyl-diphosphate geranylgeranyltransferase [Halobacteriales archaeon QS_8_69_26]